MSAKAEAAPAKAEAPAKPDGAKGDPAAKGEAAAVAAAPAAKGGLAAWIPTIAVVVLAPVITFATVEFVLVPRLQKKLAAAATPGEAHEAEPAAAPAESAPAHGGGHGAKEGKEGKEGASPNFEFSNVVVNLAGTMGTRYLKTSFVITGVGGSSVKAVFEASKPRLTDVTLNVLSSLTLSDLEEPGSKNVIREKLVNAYNQALGRKTVEQIYFADFVVQ